MKKYTKLITTIAILAGTASVAFADGNAFTPLNFDEGAYSTPQPSYSAPQSNYSAPTAQPETQTPVQNFMSKVFPNKEAAKNTTNINANGEVPIGNDNIQNAILELDNAQVGIRNDLLNYKSKYADVDAQYKLVKNERAMLHKQVRSIERRIKNIDKAKEKIRKNML